jgi:hypothetical protein
MSVKILSNASYVGYGIPIAMIGTGGTAPYTYSVAPDGVGGSISVSGIYTAPNATGYDVIKATDSLGISNYYKIYVGTVMHLIADIIQKELSLEDGRVYLWDQKIMMPTDSGLFIPIAMLSVRPYSNISKFDNGVLTQTVNSYALLSIDVISKDASARDRKEEILMALNSQYAKQQMEINSFYIANQPTGFQNISQIDGAAIPYRFTLTVGIQYKIEKSASVDYFDDFQDAAVTVDQ